MKRTLALPLVLLLLVAAAPPPKTAKVATPPPAPSDLDRVSAGAESLGIAGFYSKQLTPPTGTEVANETDYVRVRYAMWASPGGKLVDWIAAPGTAVTPLRKLFDGMRTVLLQMRPGETRRVWIPESMGAAGRVPAGGHLVADIDLVEILKAPPAPSNVTAPPADAIRTKSGLAYVVLQPGAGTKHPKRGSEVRVNYSGWTTDGKLFDSSVTRGEPAEFSLENVIAGWREGIQLMTEGERVRFWVPGDLAYGEQPNKPHGTLVFDVELLKILK